MTVVDARFAAEGTILVTIQPDHVSIWNYDIEGWPDVACEFAGRNLTRTEWDEFGPQSVEYRATCPQFPIE